jgi:magnesium transporter
MIGVLEAMSSDDRADLLKALPENTVNALLPLMTRVERNDVRKLMAHPEGTAGSLMTTAFASISKDRTAAGALSDLRVAAHKKETIYYVYVTDPQGALLGVCTLYDLIFARPETRVEQIMNRDVITVTPEFDDEEMVKLMQRYDFIALPVVDDANRLLGIVTHDDVLDLVKEEATEDAHRMGAIEPLEDPYLRSSVLSMIGKRGGWLLVLFAAQILTITLLRGFETTFETTLALIFFIPLIISSGGNVGSQSATLITRGLAVGDVHVSSWARVLGRELLTGLALGIALGTCGFAVSTIMGSGSRTLEIGCTVACTILCIVIFGAVTGSLLPLLLKRIGLDPAMTSSPFVASLVDVAGIGIYAAMATLFL